MRYLSALFEGYIGFYNGMGLNSLYIDFTQCRNKIVVIRGSNGVGKSTLLNALNLFPDPSNAFIPNMDGNKILRIDNNGDIYDIRILSSLDNSGNRKNKCFISKNGLELNSNGNVTSYKDILFSEFDLDSNFLSLTRLSSTNRGLGLLTPAERKRFISSIIENLEVYNDIYKTLNKRSTIYKSQVNNLHTKIQNIGNRDALESRLFSMQSRAKELSSKINTINGNIIALQAKYSFDNDEVNTINLLNSQLSQINSQINTVESSMNISANKLHISTNNIKTVYENDKALLQDYTVKYESFKSQYDAQLANYGSIVESINSLEASLSSYSSNIDESLESSYNNSKSILENAKSVIESLGFSTTNSSELITILSIILNFFKDLYTSIDFLYDDCSTEELLYISTKYESNRMGILQTKLSDTINKVNSLEIELSNTRDKIKKVSVLDDRPKKCNIDDCPFIKEAFEIKSNSGNKIYKDLEDLQDSQYSLSNELVTLNNEIELCRHADLKKATLDKILADIDKNMEYLSILKVDILTDRNKFLSLISTANNFNSIRYPDNYIELRNQLLIYESERSIFDKLKVEYEAQNSKLELLESNSKLLDKLRSDKDTIIVELEKSKSNLDKYAELKSSFSNKVDNEYELLNLVNTYNGLLDSRKPIEDKLNEYNKRSSQLSSVLSKVEEYKSDINSINEELVPLNEEISKTSGQLLMLESYYTEYNDSKSKFDMMEVLKKYCSPTGSGIQVLFIQLYMAKTLELCNQILSMLFNGEYRLLDFVINPNEFRIPFIGNGLPIDDISSGSESQICMMSMIINLVLLHQASTKFNICRLDEIDAPLDYSNRAGFVNVLYRIISILNIDQLFIISHNTELDASIADVIKLKYTGTEYDNDDNSNIIFDYSKL